MTVLKRLRIFMALVCAIFMLSSLLGFNILQLLSLGLRPFSPLAFRRVNRWCANSWWGFAVVVAEKCYGIQPIFSGDIIPRGENAIVIANHQEMPDILAIMMFAIRKGRLGDMKWFAKNIIKFVPGVGWGMIFLDCVFLKRHWNSDASSVLKTFQNLLDHKMPFWLVSFPEGTRIKPRKLASALLHARRKNLWIPTHTLIPRTKGFSTSVMALRSRAHAVYDLTIGYENSIPSLLDMLLGRIQRIHIHAKRTEVASLPLEESELASWLLARYELKNNELAYFKAHHHFPPSSQQI